MAKEKNTFKPMSTAEKKEFGKKFSAAERKAYQAGKKAEMRKQAGMQINSGFKRLDAIKKFK